MDRIPDEIWAEIFSYLKSDDLWQCLKVSKHWRNNANSNILWRKICHWIGIDDIPLRSGSGPTAGLCDWASAYYVYYLSPIKNWRSDRFKLFCVPFLEEADFIDKWEGNRVGVYYYKIDLAMVHEIYPHGIVSSEVSSLFQDRPREVFSLSMKLCRSYFAISNYNIVVVLKKNSNSFTPFKILYVLNDELKIAEYSSSFMKNVLAADSLVRVKAVTNNELWISNDYDNNYFVIDLIKDTILHIPARSYFLRSVHSPFIALWDDTVHLYDTKGNGVFYMGSHCWDICFNSEILVAGVKKTQKVETWRITTGKKLYSKSVLYHTDFVIHYKKNIVVLAEKSIDVYRLTCIDAIKGTTLWTIVPSPHATRCNIMKVVSEYIFICHHIMSRLAYDIFDIKDGTFIRTGLLVQNKTHVHNTYWVSYEHNSFKVMSYMVYTNGSQRTLHQNTPLALTTG